MIDAVINENQLPTREVLLYLILPINELLEEDEGMRGAISHPIKGCTERCLSAKSVQLRII